MPNPTRQEIIDANTALEKLNHLAWNGSEDMYDKRLCALWKKQILAALPPIPQPTMAEVEWDDDKHYLAEAESEEFGRAIMLQKGTNQLITCFLLENPNYRVIVFFPKDLTPTGKRYTLTEIEND